MAVTCPSCGSGNPDDARYCSSCGTALEAPAGRPTEPGPVEERRTVSVLFADLAGFTTASDMADPEDVRQTLVPFHAAAKEEIERFGGTLDKFIGDAAMGVFGAPIAHEDDPERAVRAALAIQDRANELELHVRVAVNTGEAVVAFAVGPQVGENVAGDVVNTASRLQSVAPPGGVVVGETTFRATRAAIAYGEIDPVTVKGKRDPLRLWLAESVRSSAPGREEDDPPPFVGRTRERSMLLELFRRTIRDGGFHMVKVVGEPGIGKSRLVADLGDRVRSQLEPVLWLRGRCLSYGEGVVFAPLEEIVRTATGISSSDPRGMAVERLGGTVDALGLAAEQADWLRARLAPLVGIAEERPEAAATDRAESFAAWALFLVTTAERAPLVLVVEDLHWAEDAMLDFLDELAGHPTRGSLLLVGTARSELLDRRTGWGADGVASTTISLAPLEEAEMRELLGELMVRTMLPQETGAPLVATAGGNPLYAREFVRMLGDRSLSESESSGEIQVPDSVQALIAARLDSLGPDQRSLLQDAAVVGDRFWPGVLASMSPDHDVDGSLRELLRRGLIRRSVSPSVGDEIAYTFTHGLIRDVAFGQIPRASRLRRHIATARWLETTAGDELDERAEPIAYHATEALELARRVHAVDEIPGLEATSRRYLILAGDRQLPLDAQQAADLYERALALTDPHDPERPETIRKATSTAWRAGRIDATEAVRAYREGLDGALSAGDVTTAAHIMRRLYFQLGLVGDGAEARRILDRGIDLLEGKGPSPMLAELYASRAEDEMFAGRTGEALRWADRALELPHTDTTAQMALHIRGDGRCALGDLGGLDDLWEALHGAESGGSALNLVQSSSYLSEWLGLMEGPARGLELNRRAIDACELRGLEGQSMWARAESMWLLFDAGEWDTLLEGAQALIAWGVEHHDRQVEAAAASYRTRTLAHRRELAGAGANVSRLLEGAREIKDLQILCPSLVTAALVRQLLGREQEALALLSEFDEATREAPTEYREFYAPETTRVALAAGDAELAERLTGERPLYVNRVKNAVVSARAQIAEAGDRIPEAVEGYRAAALAWETHGERFERAMALAGSARCLRALGREREAEIAAATAEQLAQSMGIPDGVALGQPGSS